MNKNFLFTILSVTLSSSSSNIQVLHLVPCKIISMAYFAHIDHSLQLFLRIQFPASKFIRMCLDRGIFGGKLIFEGIQILQVFLSKLAWIKRNNCVAQILCVTVRFQIDVRDHLLLILLIYDLSRPIQNRQSRFRTACC
jgi:hypothetical protein